jgi:hypothetical protein
MPTLVTQAEFARRCGVTRQAIHRQVAEGVIPTHGAAKLIDPAEAGACYLPRLDAGAPQARALPPAPEPLRCLEEGREATRRAGVALAKLADAIARGQARAARAALARYTRAHRTAWRAWAARLEAELAGRLVAPDERPLRLNLTAPAAAHLGALVQFRVEQLLYAFDLATDRAAAVHAVPAPPAPPVSA